MKRRFLIAGNWKMNTNFAESKELTSAIKSEYLDLNNNNTDVLVCPPFTNLLGVVEATEGTSINVGAQNMFHKDSGAFTGEISPLMLQSLSIDYVIIGHSERRTIFGEGNELLNLKLKAALNHKIKPIFCIGETLEERQSNTTEEVLKKQLSEGFADIYDLSEITIAYEPVWAIGTGVAATSEQAQETHKFIRTFLAGEYGAEAAEKIRILYGGSLNEKNAKELLSQEDIDGGLIGGASLKADSFISIIQTALNLS